MNHSVRNLTVTIAEESFKATFEGIQELEEFFFESLETLIEEAFPKANATHRVRNQSEDTFTFTLKGDLNNNEYCNNYEDEEETLRGLVSLAVEATLTEANNRTHLAEQNV